MSEPGQGWWDREVDQQGERIRTDVRAAAGELWERANILVESALGDRAAAGELMELSVEQASHYLDRKKIPVNSQNQVGLLLIIFRRLLARRRLTLNRLEPVGGVFELAPRLSDNWAAQIDDRLDLAKIVGLLSDKSRETLSLRSAGYDWSEIAELMDTSVSSVKGSFWGEIRRLRQRLRGRTIGEDK